MNDVPLSIRAAVALSEGQTLKSHLCIREPVNRRELIRVSIGRGHITAQGGEFETFRAGVIRIIASEFEGELVISKPSAQSYAPRGQKCRIGPTILAPTSGEKH